MSYFSQTKGDRDTKGLESTPASVKADISGAARKPSQEIISTLGPGLLITGNVVSTGTVQIFGRVIGDIHAARLLVSKGAVVEGKVMVQDASIEGTFKGTIYGNSVKLQATANVEGEIFKQALVIEENAQFEGVARRLDKAVEAPTNDQVNGKAEPVVALVPEQIVGHAPVAHAAIANGQGAGLNGGAPAGQTFGVGGPANGNTPADTNY